MIATAAVGTDEIEPGTGAIISPAHDPHRLAAALRSYRDDLPAGPPKAGARVASPPLATTSGTSAGR